MKHFDSGTWWRSALGTLVLCALSSGACAAGAKLPDYVRYRQDARGARLEVAIRSFTLPSRQTVDLMGVVHIADAAYYEELNRRFDAYDSVLFELVGDPRRLTELPADSPVVPGGGSVSFIQTYAAKHLGLTFQLGAIDYTGKNMVHADATTEEFAIMQRERGETLVTLFVRAMQAQMAAQMSGGKVSRAASELDTFGLIRILMSPDSSAAFKKALARNFDQMEAMTALMEGDQGSAILTGRNELVVRKIRETLGNRKQRRIAVFYGGAHMPGIETTLVKDMEAKVAGEEWLVAWQMPGAG